MAKTAKRKQSGNPAKAAWQPLQVGPAKREGHPQGMAHAFYTTDGRKHWYSYRNPQRATACLAFYNDRYNGFALVFEDTSMHLSFKRNDRAAVRDWRHFQAIKNEVAGPEREAVEIFPSESRLVDGANEYHLWVAPKGAWFLMGFDHSEPQLLDAVDNHDNAQYRRGGKAGSKQRGWEEGIPTGLGTVNTNEE